MPSDQSKSLVPDRSEWKRWSPLDRATYLAQISVPITLLATVIFSWMAWRESHVARIEQGKFFIAGSAPDLDLVEATISAETNGILAVKLRNTGGAPATRVRI